MTTYDEISDESPAAPQAASSLGRLLFWHIAWIVAVLVGALGVNAASGGLDMTLAAPIAAGMAPALFVLVARPDETEGRRMALIVVWGVCAAIATSLTGGLGGPMSAWCLTPLVVAALLGGRRIAGLAAGVSLMAVLAVLFAQLAGAVDAAPTGMIAFALGVTAILPLLVGMWIAVLAVRARRPAPAVDVVPMAASPEALSILNAQADKVLVLDPEGRVQAAFGQLAGAPEPGEMLSAVVRPEDRDALMAALKGPPSSFGFIPAADLDRHLTLEVQPYSEGRLVGVLRDTTQVRDREDSLDAARVEAEERAAGKSRFLAGMSHELRTPLNAIMGFSDIMRTRLFGDISSKYQEYAELIHESGGHLLDLINDVLDMSKIEAQRYELNLDIFDPREPVSAALRILRNQADEAGVRLRANLAVEGVEVEADRRAIKQIVINLVSNALKFTPRDGSVIVGLAARGRDLELTVADTGIGIAPDDLVRLGRPYEQAGDVRGRSKGTGLGLSLVRAFAELHGGAMVIESRLGEGTAVTVTMPVVVIDTQDTSGNVVAFKPQR